MCTHENIFKSTYYFHCKECLEIVHIKSKNYWWLFLLVFLPIFLSYKTISHSEGKTILPERESVSKELIAMEFLKCGLSFEYLDEAMHQVSIESSYGSSNLAKKTNNLLGMRYPRQRPTTAIGVYKTENNGEFAVFKNWRDCIKDYMIRLYGFNSFESSLNSYDTQDYKNKILNK